MWFLRLWTRRPLPYTFEVVRVGNDDSETALSVSEIEQWIEFDADSSSADFRTFTFKPRDSTHAGRYKVTVVATDAGIGGDDATKKSVSAAFELEVAEVNDAPEPPDAATLPKSNLEAHEDLKSTYQVPVFTDEETSTLTYTFSVVRVATNGDETEMSPPYEWIKFDDDSSSPTFRTFTFRPSDSTHAGDYRFRVTATDEGIGGDLSTAKSDYVEFMLEVSAENDLPEGQKLANQDMKEDAGPLIYAFDRFKDEESSALVHTASWAAQGTENDAGEKVFVPLPDDGWIEFGEDPDDPTKMKFTFTPSKSSHAGLHKLRVTATDAEGGETFRGFFLQVSPVNDEPQESSLANQDDVVEDTPSSYVFDAFTDEENDAAGVSLKYTFSVVRVATNGDETALSVL